MAAALAEALSRLDEAKNLQNHDENDCLDHIGQNACQALTSVILGDPNVAVLEDEKPVDEELTRTALRTLQTYLGATQIRSIVLDLLPRVSRSATRQILLDHLPWTVMEDDDSESQVSSKNDSYPHQDAILQTMEHVLVRDASAVLSVLECLSAPGMVSRTELCRVAVQLLPECEEKELPTAAQILLRRGCGPSETECATAWRALRIEWGLLEEYYGNLMKEEHQHQDEQHSEQPEQENVGTRLLLAHAVVSSFRACNHGNVLASTYLQFLESNCTVPQRTFAFSDDEPSPGCQQNGPLMLDLIVLLVLSETHEDVVDRIVDSWLCSGKGFPFVLLDELLQMLFGSAACVNSLFIPRLTPALIRWAIFLLLGPARCPESVAVLPVQGFVVNLFHSLDGNCQAELVQTLLHLSEETAPLPIRIAPDESKVDQSAAKKVGSKRRRQQTQDVVGQDQQQKRRLVHESVNTILKQMAGTTPNAFACFKHMLTRRLMEVHSSLEVDDLDSVRETCSILSCLVVYPEQQHNGALESSELLALLQKLLFSSSGTFGRNDVARGVRGDSCRMIRGMLLATELIRRPLRSSDKDCIKEWVLQLLLPTTRRMVSPELGAPGLEFLKSYLGSKEQCASAVTSTEVFQHLKLVLASTGLIQILGNYHCKENDATVLGYTTHPPEFQLSDSSKTRKMVFCFAFFLRHMDMSNPSRWHHATKWVSGLVDNYLRMGREHTTNWRPDGWLLASEEFPTLALSLDVTDRKQKFVHDWVRANLFQFSISESFQLDQRVPSDFALIALRNIDLNELLKLERSMLQFTLSLLISIALSETVLKNAFQHWKAQRQVSSEPPSLALIKLQLSKIYDLRRKSEQMDMVLRSVHVGISSSLSGKRKGGSKVEKERLLLHIASAVCEAEKLRRMRNENERIVGTEIVWECLADPRDEELHSVQVFSAGGRSQNEVTPPANVISRAIHLKTNLLRHIWELVSTPNCTGNALTETRFLHCLRQSCLLMDCIPSLRRVIFEQSDPNFTVSLPQVVLLTTSYLRLVVAVGWVVRTKNVHAVSLERYVEWCSRCPELFDCDERRALSNSIVDVSLSFDFVFDAFERRLRETDTSSIADSVLEILSILSSESEDQTRTLRVIECNWVSLHTIYTREEIAAKDMGLPFAILEKPRHLTTNALSSDIQVLQNVLDTTINKLNVLDKDPNFLHLRRGVLRHLGLLTRATSTMFWHVDHVSALIGYLSSLCESLDNDIDSGEEEKKEGDLPVSNRALLPAIIGLEAATFADYFEMLFNVVVVLTTSSGPTVTSRKKCCSPYEHLIESFGLFRRLLVLYQKHFVIFPRKTASCVIGTAKVMLTVAVSQLRCCVNWRSAQPLLSIAERQSGKHDMGSIVYLQQFIEQMAAQTSSALVVFCDFWQAQDDDVVFSRCASLRLAAEKAARSIKDISALHNLVPPTFELNELDNPRSEKPNPPPKGFHAMDSDSYSRQGKIRRLIEDTEEIIGMDDASESASKDDDNDSADSFGVSGGWGNASEDCDSGDEGLVLESNLQGLRE